MISRGLRRKRLFVFLVVCLRRGGQRERGYLGRGDWKKKMWKKWKTWNSSNSSTFPVFGTGSWGRGWSGAVRMDSASEADRSDRSNGSDRSYRTDKSDRIGWREGFLGWPWLFFMGAFGGLLSLV